MSQPDWAKLAEPFPEEAVKLRPGAATYDHKPNCQGKNCRETRDASKHHQFSYVDARVVAERLDAVLTPAGWQFTCHVIGGDVVAGHLAVRVGDDWIVREDHGYPNSDRDEEPIKAATSDALKRCAVLFGVGRHLYDDNSPKRPTRRTSNGAAGSSAPAPNGHEAAGRSAPLRPVASTVPPEPDWMNESPNGHRSSVAVAGSVERMTVKEVLAAAEAAGIEQRQVGATARKLYGTSMLKDLDDEQRAVVWQELQP